MTSLPVFVLFVLLQLFRRCALTTSYMQRHRLQGTRYRDSDLALGTPNRDGDPALRSPNRDSDFALGTANPGPFRHAENNLHNELEEEQFIMTSQGSAVHARPDELQRGETQQGYVGSYHREGGNGGGGRSHREGGNGGGGRSHREGGNGGRYHTQGNRVLIEGEEDDEDDDNEDELPDFPDLELPYFLHSTTADNRNVVTNKLGLVGLLQNTDSSVRGQSQNQGNTMNKFESEMASTASSFTSRNYVKETEVGKGYSDQNSRDFSNRNSGQHSGVGFSSDSLTKRRTSEQENGLSNPPLPTLTVGGDRRDPHLRARPVQSPDNLHRTYTDGDNGGARTSQRQSHHIVNRESPSLSDGVRNSRGHSPDSEHDVGNSQGRSSDSEHGVGNSQGHSQDSGHGVRNSQGLSSDSEHDVRNSRGNYPGGEETRITQRDATHPPDSSASASSSQSGPSRSIRQRSRSRHRRPQIRRAEKNAQFWKNYQSPWETSRFLWMEEPTLTHLPLAGPTSTVITEDGNSKVKPQTDNAARVEETASSGGKRRQRLRKKNKLRNDESDLTIHLQTGGSGSQEAAAGSGVLISDDEDDDDEVNKNLDDINDEREGLGFNNPVRSKTDRDDREAAQRGGQNEDDKESNRQSLSKTSTSRPSTQTRRRRPGRRFPPPTRQNPSEDSNKSGPPEGQPPLHYNRQSLEFRQHPGQGSQDSQEPDRSGVTEESDNSQANNRRYTVTGRGLKPPRDSRFGFKLPDKQFGLPQGGTSLGRESPDGQRFTTVSPATSGTPQPEPGDLQIGRRSHFDYHPRPRPLQSGSGSPQQESQRPVLGGQDPGVQDSDLQRQQQRPENLQRTPYPPQPQPRPDQRQGFGRPQQRPDVASSSGFTQGQGLDLRLQQGYVPPGNRFGPPQPYYGPPIPGLVPATPQGFGPQNPQFGQPGRGRGFGPPTDRGSGPNSPQGFGLQQGIPTNDQQGNGPQRLGSNGPNSPNGFGPDLQQGFPTNGQQGNVQQRLGSSGPNSPQGFGLQQGIPTNGQQGFGLQQGIPTNGQQGIGPQRLGSSGPNWPQGFGPPVPGVEIPIPGPNQIRNGQGGVVPVNPGGRPVSSLPHAGYQILYKLPSETPPEQQNRPILFGTAARRRVALPLDYLGPNWLPNGPQTNGGGGGADRGRSPYPRRQPAGTASAPQGADPRSQAHFSQSQDPRRGPDPRRTVPDRPPPPVDSDVRRTSQGRATPYQPDARTGGTGVDPSSQSSRRQPGPNLDGDARFPDSRQPNGQLPSVLDRRRERGEVLAIYGKGAAAEDIPRVSHAIHTYRDREQSLDNNQRQQSLDNNQRQQDLDNSQRQQSLDNNQRQQSLDNNQRQTGSRTSGEGSSSSSRRPTDSLPPQETLDPYGYPKDPDTAYSSPERDSNVDNRGRTSDTAYSSPERDSNVDNRYDQRGLPIEDADQQTSQRGDDTVDRRQNLDGDRSEDDVSSFNQRYHYNYGGLPTAVSTQSAPSHSERGDSQRLDNENNHNQHYRTSNQATQDRYTPYKTDDDDDDEENDDDDEDNDDNDDGRGAQNQSQNRAPVVDPFHVSHSPSRGSQNPGLGLSSDGSSNAGDVVSQHTSRTNAPPRGSQNPGLGRDGSPNAGDVFSPHSSRTQSSSSLGRRTSSPPDDGRERGGTQAVYQKNLQTIKVLLIEALDHLIADPSDNLGEDLCDIIRTATSRRTAPPDVTNDVIIHHDDGDDITDVRSLFEDTDTGFSQHTTEKPSIKIEYLTLTPWFKDVLDSSQITSPAPVGLDRVLGTRQDTVGAGKEEKEKEEEEEEEEDVGGKESGDDGEEKLKIWEVWRQHRRGSAKDDNSCELGPWSDWAGPLGFGVIERRRYVSSECKQQSAHASIGDLVMRVDISVFNANHTYYKPPEEVGRDFEADFTRREPDQHVPRDLLLVLDASGSIEVKDFQLMREGLDLMVDLFCGGFGPGKDNNRLAIVTFASEISVVHRFSDEQSPQALRDVIANMTQTNGNTCTGDALKLAHDNIFGPENGARPNVVHETLLVTDGHSNCGEITIQEGAQLLQNVSNVYALGVGLANDTEARWELNSVVSNSNPRHIFSLERYQGFKDMLESILSRQEELPCLPIVDSGGVSGSASGDDDDDDGGRREWEINRSFV